MSNLTTIGSFKVTMSGRDVTALSSLPFNPAYYATVLQASTFFEGALEVAAPVGTPYSFYVSPPPNGFNQSASVVSGGEAPSTILSGGAPDPFTVTPACINGSNLWLDWESSFEGVSLNVRATQGYLVDEAFAGDTSITFFGPIIAGYPGPSILESGGYLDPGVPGSEEAFYYSTQPPTPAVPGTYTVGVEPLAHDHAAGAPIWFGTGELSTLTQNDFSLVWAGTTISGLSYTMTGTALQAAIMAVATPYFAAYTAAGDYGSWTFNYSVGQNTPSVIEEIIAAWGIEFGGNSGVGATPYVKALGTAANDDSGGGVGGTIWASGFVISTLPGLLGSTYIGFLGAGISGPLLSVPWFNSTPITASTAPIGAIVPPEWLPMPPWIEESGLVWYGGACYEAFEPGANGSTPPPGGGWITVTNDTIDFNPLEVLPGPLATQECGAVAASFAPQIACSIVQKTGASGRSGASYNQMAGTPTIDLYAVSCSGQSTLLTVGNGNVQINSGGTAAIPFIADEYFSGGSTSSTATAITTTALTGTIPPQSVLQTCRQGVFTYTVPGLTASATYPVTLYFAEAQKTAVGQRVFNVSINGVSVLTNFDIFALAGAEFAAVQKTFSAIANTSGQIVITTVAVTDNPQINGLVIGPLTLENLPCTVNSATGQTTLTTNQERSLNVDPGVVFDGTGHVVSQNHTFSMPFDFWAGHDGKTPWTNFTPIGVAWSFAPSTSYYLTVAIESGQEIYGCTGPYTSTTIPLTDLAIDASNDKLVSSASVTFTSAMVGRYIDVTAGTSWTDGLYLILSVSGGKATLATSPSAAGNTNYATATILGTTLAKILADLQSTLAAVDANLSCIMPVTQPPTGSLPGTGAYQLYLTGSTAAAMAAINGFGLTLALTSSTVPTGAFTVETVPGVYLGAHQIPFSGTCAVGNHNSFLSYDLVSGVPYSLVVVADNQVFQSDALTDTDPAAIQKLLQPAIATGLIDTATVAMAGDAYVITVSSKTNINPYVGICNSSTSAQPSPGTDGSTYNFPGWQPAPPYTLSGMTPLTLRPSLRVVLTFPSGYVFDSYAPVYNAQLGNALTVGLAYQMIGGGYEGGPYPTTPLVTPIETIFWVTVIIEGALGIPIGGGIIDAAATSAACDIIHRPCLAIDVGDGTTELAVTPDAGATWPTVAGPDGYWPSLVIDQRSNTFVICTNRGTASDPSGSAYITRRANADGSASSGDVTSGDTGGFAMAIFAEPYNQGHILAVYIDNATSGNLKVQQSFDGGINFTALSTIVTGGMVPTGGFAASLAWIGGALFCAYWKSADLLIVRSPDGGSTWGSSVTIATGGPYSGVAMEAWAKRLRVRAADSSGVSHLYDSFDLGATWTEVTTATVPQPTPGQPVAFGVWEFSGLWLTAGGNVA
jgi:hypothetical protein